MVKLSPFEPIASNIGIGIESSPPTRIGTTLFFNIFLTVLLIVNLFSRKFFSSQFKSPQSTALTEPLGKIGPPKSKLCLSRFAFREAIAFRIEEGPFLAYGPTDL